MATSIALTRRAALSRSPTATEFEDGAQLGGDLAERLRLGGGDSRRPPADLNRAVITLGPVGALGRQVFPAAVLAFGQQVHQRDRRCEDEIRVTVKVHLTSYFLPSYGYHCQSHLNQ